MDMERETKSVFITIAGRTNAGKSSLMNALLGEQVAVVTDKPQTTRTRITGVLTKDSTQYVFMDTPGLHKAKSRLSEHMLKAADMAAAEGEVMIFVADCQRKLGEEERNFLARHGKKKIKTLLVLNKIDLLKGKDALLALMEECSQIGEFEAILPISALTGEGIEDLFDMLESFAQKGPFFFPEDTLTDQPERVIAAEIIRGALMSLLSEEVPHGIAVTVESMKERETLSKEDILDVSANIYCERDSHKGIIIGKNGAMLKAAGTEARRQLEDFFRIKVNTQLWVKVRPDWRNKEGSIKNFGLSFKR